MNSNSSAILIQPASPGPMTNDIRPIKSPVEIPSDWAWVWWVLGGLILAALATSVLIWFLRKRVQLPLVPAIPPHIRARQKLQAALSLLHPFQREGLFHERGVHFPTLWGGRRRSRRVGTMGLS